ncbi:MAG: DNA polymerase III subunit delta [Alphaproteobacteria bacterium]|nr:DNA polymerase III subunit delta [Alphaproteobacteria bacterium]
MKVSAGRVDGFVANPDPDIVACLVYGPNTGLVRERCDTLADHVLDDPKDPFRAAELTMASLGDNPARLADELLAMTFDGGQRLIVLRDATDSLTKILEAALDTAGETRINALLAIEAGSLSGRSSLRKLCESRNDCAALPCYADEEQSRAEVSRRMLKEAGIAIEPDALRTLTGYLGEDRLSNRREIEKLILFVGREGTATEVDVQAAVGDIGVSSMDDTVFAAADGDLRQLDHAIERFWAEGGEPVGLIRANQRHFQRLHRVVGSMEGGTRYEEAAKRLRPPVFWKHSDRFQAQARAWSRSQIELALARLSEAELVLKSTGVPGQAACGRTLYAVASMRRTRAA